VRTTDSARRQEGAPEEKKIAYLLDPRTIAVMDLVSGATLCSINHDAKVDWFVRLSLCSSRFEL
jgi:hypothetical protein